MSVRCDAVHIESYDRAAKLLSGAPAPLVEPAGKDCGTKKNEFGLGILIRGTKKTSLVQGFSLILDFLKF